MEHQLIAQGVENFERQSFSPRSADISAAVGTDLSKVNFLARQRELAFPKDLLQKEGVGQPELLSGLSYLP